MRKRGEERGERDMEKEGGEIGGGRKKGAMEEDRKREINRGREREREIETVLQWR